jgi:hypothetical protein
MTNVQDTVAVEGVRHTDFVLVFEDDWAVMLLPLGTVVILLGIGVGLWIRYRRRKRSD